MLIASLPIFGVEWGVFPLFQTQFARQAWQYRIKTRRFM
jgi:hypothetical protein